MSRWAFAAGGLLTSCLMGLAAADNTPNLKDPDMIAAGGKLFEEKHCAFCHGPRGSGAIRLAGRSDLEPKYVFETITEGRTDGPLRMPSWRGVLTEDQIWQATAYIMSLSSR